MASIQHYLTFSVIVALCYAVTGIFVFNVFPDVVLLASVIIVLTGLLPEIDSDSVPPAREVGGFIAAIMPILLLEYFPGIRTGGVVDISIIIIVSYLITRIIIVRLLQKHTTQMGMMHSIPAAIITFEVCYLFFYDLFWTERLFIASAAFVGYFSHLVLDASSNLDLFGQVTGNAKRAPSALKLAVDSTFTNITAYGLVLYLGWFVLSDIFPNLKISAGIQY